MKILSKYVLKEHAGPLTFALTALTSLLLLNYIAKQFGQLVGKGLAWKVIGEFFLLSIPFTIAMTLPMAVLVATLYAFSRLASENEITAMKASGVSLVMVMIPVLLGASVLSLAMVGFNDQVLPRSNHRLSTLQGDIARKKPTFALNEQVINEVSPGKLFLRAVRIEKSSNMMRDVTIYDMEDPQRHRTIIADSGNMALTPDQRDLVLTLYDGYMQEIPRTEPSQLQRLFYTVDFIRVRGVGNTFESSQSSYKSDREMSICEMQNELANAEREKSLAVDELEQLLRAAVREAALGAPPPPMGKADPGKGSRGLGRVYCDMLGRLQNVKQVAAAKLGRVSLASVAGAQSPAARQQPTKRPPRPRLPEEIQDSIDVQNAIRGTLPAARPTPPRRLALPAPGLAPSSGLSTITNPNMAPMGNNISAGMVESSMARITDRQRSMNALDVEIQKKFALAVACVVFVLLGAPIALRFPRGGVGLVIGVSLSVFALYYVCLIAGETLADKDIASPFWSMWGANVLFSAVGLVLLARMGRESSTSRGGDMSELLDTLRSAFARVGRRIGLGADRRRRVA